jgi:hypothetical protein
VHSVLFPKHFFDQIAIFPKASCASQRKTPLAGFLVGANVAGTLKSDMFILMNFHLFMCGWLACCFSVYMCQPFVLICPLSGLTLQVVWNRWFCR